MSISGTFSRLSWVLLLLPALAACQTARSGSVPLGRVDVIDLAVEPQPDAKAYHAFVQAELFLADGSFAAAAESLVRAVADDPDNVTLRLALADALLQGGRDAEAVQVAEAALQRWPDDVELLLFLGNQAFNRDDVAVALHYFQRAYAVAPAHESAGFHLAVAIARNGDFVRAVDVLREVLTHHPDFSGAELMLARLYRQLDLIKPAEEILRQMVQREPELEAPYLELGSLYESRKELAKALQLLREGVAANPENTVLRHQLVRLLVYAEKLAEARVELETLVRQDPDDSEALRKIGLIYLEEKRFAEAEKVFQGLVERFPDQDQLRFYLGSAFERQDKFEPALAQFETIAADSSLFVDALTHRAYLLHNLGRTGEAAALLEGILDRPDLRPEHYFYLVSLYEAEQQNAAAERVVERALARFSADAEVAYRAAGFYERHGDHGRALNLARQAIATDPQHAEALNFIAYDMAEQNTGDLHAALEMAQRAAELKPEGHIFDTLGWVWFRLHNYAKARFYLEKAVSALGDDPVVLEHLGDVLSALKLYPPARDAYRRSLKAQPDNPAVREKLHRLPQPEKKLR